MNTTIFNKMAQMKLHGMWHAYKTLQESHHSQQLTHDELIDMLVQAEWEQRENQKFNRLVRQARFRYMASVEQVDFTALRGLDKNQFLRLAECNFVQKQESLLLTGATGVGKSFLASALGHQACLLGYRTLYFNTQKLFSRLKMLKADGSYSREIIKIEKADLIILDDFGMQPLDNGNRMIFLEIIEDRHGRKSTLIASQLPVSKWYEIIGESTIADAILDRMVHSAHRIELKGESMRKIKK